jgi:hypothetical protein
MAVDIKERGLDYELKEGLDPVTGVKITGSFYDALTSSQVDDTKRDLAELVQYISIPVFMNGERINRDPVTEKWDHDTELAWVKLREAGSLSIFNQGVLVKKVDARVFGTGGVVCTKPGVRLGLNMARTEILVSSCPVWKKIAPLLQSISDERTRKKRTRLSDDELDNIVKRMLDGELVERKFWDDEKLVTLINGRRVSLNQLWSMATSRGKMVVAPDGDSIAGKAHDNAIAAVLHPKSLVRFEVDSVKAFGDNCARIAQQIDEFLPGSAWIKLAMPLESQRRHVQCFDNVADANLGLAHRHEPVKRETLTAWERAVRYALQEASKNVRIAVLRVEHGQRINERVVEIGESDTAELWTDGSKFIWVNRRLLSNAKRGISGWNTLILGLLHEYLHNASTAGSHAHDFDFYSRFHNISSHPEYGTLHMALEKAISALRRYCLEHKVKVPRELTNSFSRIDAAGTLEADGEGGPVDVVQSDARVSVVLALAA